MRDVIIALDFPNRDKTLAFLDLFGNKKPFVKIGMELFYAEGHSLLRDIKARGHKIFLDLKLHDIPNTVKSAMRAISNLGIDMVNVHASGGIIMMQAALEGLSEANSAPILIAVTQLTSTSQDILQKELMINSPINDVIVHYALNARFSGLRGVVCSPLEVAAIKQACGNDFITVTPGIRFADNNKDDQVRITTPADAKKNGSDFIVVGRPITQADNPVEMYCRCLNDFCG
ncbi:orotidine 5'-phosphate decarboxylase [Porphyromonadaceae bacterium COT-184 OH4590]|nr:orotidine 5'-phosphate decarboxylase [Porphyromonadaceae bacterium COT-184 OH4590]MDO4726896.1 orotidine-5'-phosphate decarboxylase [Porphyromonadaceae bacterium]